MQKTGDAMTDRELLRLYADSGSQDAFSELVRRHINWVYAVCLRRVRDAALAEDVTQAVFIVLARKAAQLSNDTAMTGWLMMTAKFASADALKAQRRRQHHEAAAAKEQAMSAASSAPAASNALLADLDDAVLRLSDADRSVVVLRYYRNLSVLEVAESLGISEDAAKKRLTRSINRLRKLMGAGKEREGYALDSSLPMLLAITATQAAPAGLAQSTVVAAITGKAGAALAIAKGALSMMAWSKAKTLAVAAIFVASLGATTAMLIVSATPARTTPSTTTIAPVTQPNNPLESITIDADPDFHRVIPKRRLRFTDSAGASNQFQLVLQVWGTPDKSVEMTDIVIERDGDKSAMLIRTMSGRPYLIANAGWAVRLDDRAKEPAPAASGAANTPGLIVAEGVWPDVLFKAVDGAPRDHTIMDWHATLDRTRTRLNVDLASIIEAILADRYVGSYNAGTGAVKLHSSSGGGLMTLPRTAATAPDTAAFSQFTFSEVRRLGLGIDKVRVGRATRFSLTTLTQQNFANLGVPIRRVTPEEFGAAVVPPARFWDSAANRDAASKLAVALVAPATSSATTRPDSPR